MANSVKGVFYFGGKVEEVWKDIPGYEGLYQVSSIGKVRSLPRLDLKGRNIKGKAMAFHPHHKGYLKVLLTKNGQRKGKFVHILVAITFIGPIPNKMQCNHKNGNKMDNRLENLEYCTASENMLHAYRILGKPSNLKDEKHWSSKLTKQQVEEIRRLYASGNYTQNKLSLIFHVRQGHISKIILGKRWT